ncbi:hypothetical protein DL1_11415 [Thioclava dalianensis]|uniref:Uncharacterized protein n=1 Tax=Thioclava dalianensis TaxID=1185766 RepID=A0A074TEE0_9RHOB|nr:hypothetical protein [Thioclava dalianensis]KEP68545.1 hypothetical protein DL1_11415 [Thioclava dalianensis]SFN84027.1 hypothetical protein SAMN05216224_11715 [Thioclava dalianensis]
MAFDVTSVGPLSDAEIVQHVRDAAENLNRILSAASKAGLALELETTKSRIILGERVPPTVKVNASRPL